MTSIHFSFNAPDRLLTACRIAARRHEAGDALAVYCRNLTRLKHFDRLLWDYERAAFVPHVDETDPLAERTGVVLYANPPPPTRPWVLNLDDDCIPAAAGFRHIIEVVSADASDRRQGRARWRQYQAAGFNIVQHDVADNDLP